MNIPQPTIHRLPSRTARPVLQHLYTVQEAPYPPMLGCGGRTPAGFSILYRETRTAGVGLELDRSYHGVELPWKFKIGVSVCPIVGSETRIKGVGLVGIPKGWRLTVGGNGRPRPELANS